MKAYAQKQNKPPAQTSPNLTRSNPVRFQAKLSVNAPGDIYEQEADRVAAWVTSMPKLQRRHKDEEGLQTKSIRANDVGAIEAPAIVTEALHSSGQSLDASTRAFMEPRFGHDFSRVRVHTDACAATSAKAVNALAYTVGNDIAFSEGRFTPHTTEGRKLLAHELAHVVQSNQSVVQRQVPAPLPPKESDRGESVLPDVFNFGIGTVDNQTNKTFIAEASEKKDTPKLLTKLGPGKWGGSKPAQGPQGEKLRDIDFVFATPTTPINGQVKGKFKIGSNDATISPDPADSNNSEIDDFTQFEK